MIIGGVSIILSGAQTGTVVADENGFYSFTINSVGDYSLTPSKQHYIFNPQQQTFNHLGDNQKADFSGALLQYAISGRVTEGGVQGLPGMTLSLV